MPETTYSANADFLFPTSRPQHSTRGRPQVLASSDALLLAFEFFYRALPTALIDWTIGQQAFNACMILLLDMQETRNLLHQPRVDLAFLIFRELDNKGVHKLAQFAVSRISRESVRLRDLVQGTQSSAILSRPLPVQVPPSIRYVDVTQQRHQPSFTDMHAHVDVTECAFQYTEPVMGSTGMILLEDPGLQSQSALHPLFTAGVRGADTIYSGEKIQLYGGHGAILAQQNAAHLGDSQGENNSFQLSPQHSFAQQQPLI